MRDRAVDIPDEIRKAIAKLNPDTKKKIRAALDAISEDPTIGEPLEDELASFRKIALGSWRIVYRQDRRVIVVRAIGRRATVYSDLIGQLARKIEERRRRYGRPGEPRSAISRPKRKGGTRARDPLRRT